MSDCFLHTISAGDFEMEYACFGEGPKPLVIIPGLALKNPIRSVSALEGPYHIFQKDFTLYFFDRKKKATPGYTLQEMARDQMLALKALGISKASIYGVSQGGMVAQYMAILYPEIIDKLVLASTSSRAEPLQLKTIGHWADLAEAHEKEALVNAFIEDCFSSNFVARYRRALLMMYKELSLEEQDRFAVFARACAFVDTYDDLGKIKSPVQILAAGNDQVVTAEASAKIFEKLKSENVPCEFYSYPDCGHAVFDELREYKERIYSFLCQPQ